MYAATGGQTWNGGPGTTGPHAGDGPDHLYFCGECIYANFLICGDGNLRQGEAWNFFQPGPLRGILLPKERYGNSLSGRGSNNQLFNWEVYTLPLNYHSIAC